MGTGDRFTAEPIPPTDAFSRALSGIILPIALMAALVVALYPFRDDLNTGTIALVLLLPPLLATIGGLRTAMAMAVVGSLTFNFFFTEPYNSFRMTPRKASRPSSSTCWLRSSSHCSRAGCATATEPPQNGFAGRSCCSAKPSSC